MTHQTSSEYAATLARLFALSRFGEKRSLDGPRALEEALGNPLAGYRSVIIGGTNGKGSTCAFLEAALRARGVRTGLYTSPHLMSYRERFRIDGVDVDAATLVEAARPVLAAADRLGGSFFESSWALAACLFRAAGVEVAIWEVGMGGRLDATNVCDPVASAVVSIGLDHTAALGETIPEIAREKAGIFRAGRPALTTAGADALPTLRAAAPQLEVVAPRDDLPALPLPGAYQRHNASLALAVAEAIGHGGPATDVLGVRWPGRVERFERAEGDVIIDCAHNIAGAQALGAWLDDAGLWPHLVFGVMADKQAAEMAAVLGARAATVTVVTPDYPRSLDARHLAHCFVGHPRVSVIPKVARAIDARPADAVTVVAGSCYLAGEARAHLLGVEYPECRMRTMAR